MIPNLLLRERPMVLLASDTLTLNDAAVAVALVKAPFVPGDTTTMASLTLADFDGSTEKVPGAVPALESVDPANGDVLVDVQAPVGGWRWETTGLTFLPQTIHGYCLRNGDGDYIAGDLLDVPVVLSAVNQTVVLERVGFRLPQGAVS